MYRYHATQKSILLNQKGIFARFEFNLKNNHKTAGAIRSQPYYSQLFNMVA